MNAHNTYVKHFMHAKVKSIKWPALSAFNYTTKHIQCPQKNTTVKAYHMNYVLNGTYPKSVGWRS